ncbi:MAG TPA: DUF4129 domain-containing protein [Anaerolineales bacterium]|nr:DUF4129 domain-containing protein [Anaerolineales bacterium]
MRLFFALTVVAFLSLPLRGLSAGNALSYFAQESAPITVEAYWEMAGDTRQALTKMEALPGEEIRRQLDELAAAWEKVTAVEFPDQRVVAVDSSHLAAELRTDPPDLQRLANLLDALLQAHAQYPQEVFTVQDIESLKEILARPEFQWDAGQPAPDWLQQFLDAFFSFMERLAFGIQNTIYYGRVPLMIGAALLLLLSLVYISRNLSRSLVREAELNAQGGEDEALLTSKGALQRANSLSSQGDYRNAIRYLYLSSLLVLDERGLLRYDRSRTNREYLRSVSSKPGLAAPLRDVVDVFDRVWYGFESVDEQTYHSYLQHVDELREKKE